MTINKKKFFSIISPIMGSIYSFLFFLICIFIPPKIYSFYIDEPDLMFMNVELILYVFGCTLFFIFGAFISGLLPTVKVNMPRFKKIKLTPKLYYSAPVIITLFIVFIFVFILVKDNIYLIPFIFIGQGNVIKKFLHVPVLMSSFYYVFIGVFFWFYYNYLNVKIKYQSLKYIVYISIFVVFLISILMVARYLLIPFLLSLIIIYLYDSQNIKISFIIKIGLFIIFIFSIFTLARGGDIIPNILGYGPASYNRLAAVLSGKINFHYHLYYLFTYFDGHPKNLDVLNDEHNAIARAGLNIYLNWISVYGYIFIALKWFAFAYFFILGIFMEIIYKAYIKGKTYSKVIYPWLFSLILLWFSSNLLSWMTTVIFILTAMLLSLYETLSTTRR